MAYVSRAAALISIALTASPLALADSRQLGDDAGVVASEARATVKAPLGAALHALVAPLGGDDVVLVHGGKALSRTVQVERLDAGLGRVWSSSYELPEAKVDLKAALVFRDGRPALSLVPDVELVPGMELQAAVVREGRVLVFTSVISAAVVSIVDGDSGSIDEVALPVQPSPGGSLGFLVSPTGKSVALVALSDDQRTLDIHALGPTLGVEWHTRVAVGKPRSGTVRGLESLAIDDLGQVYVVEGLDDATVRVVKVAAGETSELSLATSERFLQDVRLLTRTVVPAARGAEPKIRSRRGKRSVAPPPPPPPRAEVALVATAGKDRKRTSSLLHARLDFEAGVAHPAPSVLSGDAFGALDGPGWWALGQVELLEGGDILLVGQQVRGAGSVIRDGTNDRVDAARGGLDDTAAWLGDIALARLAADGTQRWTHRLESRQTGKEGRLDLAGGARAWTAGATVEVLHVDVQAFRSSWRFDRIDLTNGQPLHSLELTPRSGADLAVRRLATRLPSGALLTGSVTADLLDADLQLSRYDND